MSGKTAAILCALELAAFGALSHGAAVRESPTFDETWMAVSGWAELRLGDYRLAGEQPPLYAEWAALPNQSVALGLRANDAIFQSLERAPLALWQPSSPLLWQDPAVDGRAIIARGREMMLLAALLLGALVGWWAYRLGGPLSAVLALFLLALDPNFLGHASVIKTDALMALGFTAVSYSVWSVGEKLTPARVAALWLAFALVAPMKLTCALLAPVLVLLLGARALVLGPWPARSSSLHRSGPKIAAAAAILVGALGSTALVLWASYGFRFTAAPPGSVAGMELPQLSNLRGDGFTWALSVASRGHLLPESLLRTMLLSHAAGRGWTTFLLGRLSRTGWWYYFPLAMLFKTPLAILAAVLGAVAIAFAAAGDPSSPLRSTWSVACLALGPAVVLASAMASNRDLGVRYVLAVYPPAYIACGVLAAWACRRWRVARLASGALALGLAAETLVAYPHFLSFFNVAAGEETHWAYLLGDSNLDWGQDLPLVAEWQQAHPKARLYLSYFGTVDPQAFGVRSEALPGNYLPGLGAPPVHRIEPPAVVAISASNLQGILESAQLPLVELYGRLRGVAPSDILGGTIYLYDIPDEAELARLLPAFAAGESVAP